MADIRKVTDDFAVAPQIRPEDLPEAAAQGFRLLINNRPDAEAPDQPTSAAMAEAARAAGLDYLHVPIVGGPQLGQVEAVYDAVEAAGGPVLAFCRSGTRSIVTWAIGQARHGRPRDELVRLARAAGYDLSSVLG
jgi:uncharacterized protein (TIGR01244 family)